MADIDMTKVDALMNRMSETGFIEIDYRSGDHRIRLLRGPMHSDSYTAVPDILSRPSAERMDAVSEPESVIEICAVMGGQFFTRSAPGDPPFVKAGETVSEGSLLYVLEAMKTMNKVHAEFSLRVIKTLQEDGAYVETGSPLFRVERI